MYQQDQFVKLTNPDGKNHGFQYKEGLNEDIYDLNQNEEIVKGGLHFCRFKDVGKWICDFGDALIWKVEIPEGEEVIEYEKQLKSKRIILSQPLKAYENNEICKMAIEEVDKILKFTEEQTEQLRKSAIEEKGYSIEYVKEQTEAVHQMAMQHLKKEAEKVYKLAVQNNGLALQFVKEQTEEICKLAVQQDNRAIQYVKTEFRHLF